MHCCAGLMALQSLDISGNCIEEELEVRTLAALPALRHLALAGNPVMADMDPREQRVFIVDLMPGKHSNLATCGIVTAVLERQQSVFLLVFSNVSTQMGWICLAEHFLPVVCFTVMHSHMHPMPTPLSRANFPRDSPLWYPDTHSKPKMRIA